MPSESFIELNGRRFAYLDFRGDGPVLLALHGHFGRSRIFAPMGAELAERYRVIALDQRAHGLSDSGGDLTPAAYVADVAAFLRALDLGPVAVLGHSMGGAVAYHLAASHPDLVSALIVVDMTVLNTEPETRPVLDVSRWPRRYASRERLEQHLTAHVPNVSYFLDSAMQFDDGWGFLFDLTDMMASQKALIGDFTSVWNSSHQPALLIRGSESFILMRPTADRMVESRPETDLVVFPGCGHWLYAEAPERFGAEIRRFLDSL
ncbi:alpha/beta fold hydrolase [Rhodococcus jostii]|uniref:alpha/beta fold hydrolase n=1 Tax=Rhodococcus jostii TaxID=132919 RepID=UPI003635BDA9